MLPEYAALLDGSGRVMRDNSYPEASIPRCRRSRTGAGTHAWLLLGSITVK